MSEKPSEQNHTEEPSDRKTVVRQSNWAWMWPTIPWGLLMLFQFYFGDIIFMALFLFLGLITVFPRYLRWKGTSYVISDLGLTIRHPSASGTQEFDFRWSEIVSVKVSSGFLGPTFGYHTIELLLKDTGLAKMTFVPSTSTLAHEIQTQLDTDTDTDTT